MSYQYLDFLIPNRRQQRDRPIYPHNFGRGYTVLKILSIVWRLFTLIWGLWMRYEELVHHCRHIDLTVFFTYSYIWCHFWTRSIWIDGQEVGCMIKMRQHASKIHRQRFAIWGLGQEILFLSISRVNLQPFENTLHLHS